ncbi:VirB4 family type IV secretion system protein [Rhizobium sp. VS19-DR104.2]|uniref:VirB4 family type IV secretion system protein n=1 Tax=unclassified Rhizobium TaxID=2613769 RepID=UPI001CC5D71F|nr:MULTISPECIES: VirB4 family type IV secretion system protein [unclassified Rhizobium]MBZ5762288.1 VirB4 family type IV secretion system protein [Rhizobium sp. VS19-DR96]MBZ5768304.1 VirB4 family type IV secretion system protein [Rhizobium sp. VS19-DR129.2]MBZ5775824.1 VirB4 family type IV secretion system protein [Rhizobium sp. VS19-DRK62.2]MBZ5787155.1 VirB4 family type IV secretion system protein [Rhizobium sp. VS19-DR121]MBZ5804230.1 VirB4 family type IV secretion system protein [Rhizobiu
MAARAILDEMLFGSAGRRERPVSSHIPYTRHVNDQTLRTKSGHLITVLKLDGYCFETADMAHINQKLEGRNDIVRTLGNSRYAVYGHLVRREIKPELEGNFPNPFAAELNRRYLALLSERRMFVNDTYFTIVRRPLQGKAGSADSLMGRMFGAKTATGDKAREIAELRELQDTVTAVREVLSDYGARVLSIRNDDGIHFSEPLEFLVQLVNGLKPRKMRLPRMPLDTAIAEKRINFGRNAIEFVGAAHPTDTRVAAMLSVREYPAFTGPLLMDGLLKIPHEFVVSQSFAIVDRPATQHHIELVSRQVNMADQAGSVVSEHLDDARNDLLGSKAIYGNHHLTVMCIGDTTGEMDRCITAVGAALMDQSIIWVREDLNCEPAFWAQLPGNLSYVARAGMISSKNFAGFVSLHNFPSGDPVANHWGSALSLLETSSQTAYYFNFHERDLGNFTVVGPSGSGKTVALSFLMAQAQRVKPTPKCVFFDKDRGAEIFIRALGGRYEILNPGAASGFNPLVLPDTGANREFLYQLFAFMLARQDGRAPSPTEEAVIRSAISETLQAGPDGRNLDAFRSLLRGRIRPGEDDLVARLEKWVRPEQLGWLFNNAEDRFAWSDIYGFDMTRVLDDPVTRTAALMYVFHRIDELLTGDPVMIFLDEGWRLLEDDVFAHFIKDKMKTIRKLNGVIGLGTQSAADIVRSGSANTLIEQSATNLFFPNPKADHDSYMRAFHLSEREMDWILRTDPSSRAFLIKHGRDSVIARIRLTGMADLIKVLSGRAETLAELDRLRQQFGDDPAAWLPAFCGSEDKA